MSLSAPDLTLVIGTKRISSWSLRPWLAMKHAAIPFREVLVPLDQPDTRAKILLHSPSGKVPALVDGPLTVWDSLAIGEYLAERFPQAALWPSDRAARAVARSACAEMHAGFAALRAEHPMDVALSTVKVPSPAAAADIARVDRLLSEVRQTYGSGGPFLFGRFSFADCMYAPVATRFRSYAIPVSAPVEAWCDAVLSLPAMVEWTAAGRAEAGA